MIKQVRYIDNNGVVVRTDNMEFKGRFRDDKGYTLYAHGKTIHGRDFPFPPELTPLEVGYLALLSRHLLVDTNIIGKPKKKGFKKYSQEEIGAVLGLEYPYRFLKRMRELRMIVKIGRGKKEYYIMNPLFFLKGKTISDELYWLFEESMDEHLSQWIKDTYTRRRDEAREDV